MLVLARKQDESIVIGDNIIVKVVSLENGVVKLGIDAPKNISIIRDELLQEIKEGNIAASSKDVDSSVLGTLSKLLSGK
ncbi:carbon storage regulator CsrA [Sulfurimonas aquatica]|uniref:Translational regulator CsrA n=1 Tax=Sulfurimonas aquatica TaxID=2672570 RepID=A0A975GDP6_9BACT|nr:carbon storage regulator CsrA [Sulfurimonas aquatica]QSZ42534.1 carbon storage regulator CsrA [Sulfurimonas aquatica]